MLKTTDALALTVFDIVVVVGASIGASEGYCVALDMGHGGVF